MIHWRHPVIRNFTRKQCNFSYSKYPVTLLHDGRDERPLGVARCSPHCFISFQRHFLNLLHFGITTSNDHSFGCPIKYHGHYSNNAWHNRAHSLIGNDVGAIQLAIIVTGCASNRQFLMFLFYIFSIKQFPGENAAKHCSSVEKMFQYKIDLVWMFYFTVILRGKLCRTALGPK